MQFIAMASRFVVWSMLSTKYNNVCNFNNFNSICGILGILLIELLVYTVVIIISLILVANYYFNTPQQHKNLLALQKLGDALHLARSAAIKNNSNVSICPSYDLRTCNEQWTNDLIIFNDLVILHHIKLQFSAGTLNFFGKKNTNKIIFLPSGLTNNNGHFCIENNCLYINKAGKIYLYDQNSENA